MIGLAFSSMSLLVALASRYLISQQVEVKQDEKPSLANTVLPVIQQNPLALAVFWGLFFLSVAQFGAAIVSRII